MASDEESIISVNRSRARCLSLAQGERALAIFQLFDKGVVGTRQGAKGSGRICVAQALRRFTPFGHRSAAE